MNCEHHSELPDSNNQLIYTGLFTDVFTTSSRTLREYSENRHLLLG
jgi:hypothetical protein